MTSLNEEYIPCVPNETFFTHEVESVKDSLSTLQDIESVKDAPSPIQEVESDGESISPIQDVKSVEDSQSPIHVQCKKCLNHICNCNPEDNDSKSAYIKGGYHPVKIGEIYNDCYLIRSKLGAGHFSTVWLAKDIRKEESDPNEFVAIKISKSADGYTDAAKDEVKFLKKISSNDKMLTNKLLDEFDHIGPNGTHHCMVTNLLGSNLLGMIQKYHYRGLPYVLVQKIARQLLTTLAHLHEDHKIIHTDLKPENILLSSNCRISNMPRRDKLHRDSKHRMLCYEEDEKADLLTKTDAYICDFGSATDIDSPLTDDITTRQYRAPETLTGCKFNEKADIWSIGCILFELLTGDFLFNPKGGENFSKDEDHLALIVELIGMYPSKITSGKYNRLLFNTKDELLHIKKFEYWSLKDVLTQKYRLDEEDAEMFSSFLLEMLQWDPEIRCSARAALDDPWLKHV
jgi:serine/threonine-protein kinase SRPK3